MKISAFDQTYKIPTCCPYSWKKLTVAPGATQSSNTTITIIISMATFFSRLKITHASCPETKLCTSLFCRRIAMKIPTWLRNGTIVTITPPTIITTIRILSGRTKRTKIVKASHVTPVMTTALTVTVIDKTKVNEIQQHKANKTMKTAFISFGYAYTGLMKHTYCRTLY